ncbi:MAG: hypothetical protein Q7R34_08960 [Dehalococcoidia bacterium]|nr:hypothetical protein [Dehalococcoidia bacterium]
MSLTNREHGDSLPPELQASISEASKLHAPAVFSRWTGLKALLSSKDRQG